jgi:hypothetical protein
MSTEVVLAGVVVVALLLQKELEKKVNSGKCG